MRESASASVWRLGLGLAALYLAQGLVHGSQTTLVQIAAAGGRSLEHQANLVFWSLLPWVLKVVWGVLEDRLLPRDARRHALVLVVLQIAVALAMLPLAAGPDGPRVAYLLFGLNLVLSWQDVATDAFAVDHIPAPLRGRINGAMGGARALGAMVLGRIVFIAALPKLGVGGFLSVAVAVLALLSLVPLLLVRAETGARREVGPPRRASEWVRGLRPVLLLVCVLMLLGDGLISAVASEFMIGAAGWSLEQLANQLGPVGIGAELLGFALAAVLVDRVGAPRAIAGGAGLLGLTWATVGLAPALWPVHGVLFGVAVCEGLGRATLTVGVYALCMAGVDAKVRATHFLAYMALINLGPVLGAALAPKVFALGSFSGVWLCAAAMQLVLVVVASVDGVAPSTSASTPASERARA